MGRFRSRDKGARGEREVCGLLTPWWAQVEPECIFARTPGSGGWSTKDNRAAFGTAGDLVTTAERWPFAVEVKWRKKWDWDNLCAGRPTAVWAWWRQCQAAAKEMGKQPMLFFRKNNEPWHVFIPFELLFERAVRGVHCCKLEVIWTPADLRRVNYGELLPVCISWDEIAAADPCNFLPQEAIRLRKTGTRS